MAEAGTSTVKVDTPWDPKLCLSLSFIKWVLTITKPGKITFPINS